MEYIEGETLADRLKKGRLKLDQSLEVGIQIADGLDKAHRAGIVHRDLKPGNIMLTKSGVKLLDFGLAKLVEEPVSDDSDATTEQRELTQEKAVVGTPQYMAPEQIEGGVVTERTDIFALGALLFEMTTGMKAFQGESRVALLNAIVTDDAPPLAPPALDAIVRTCLEKAPNARWASAGDIAKQLAFITRDTPKPVSKRTSTVPWIAAALFAALALAALLSSGDSESRLSRLSIASPPGITLRGAVRLTPDGEAVIFSGGAVGGSQWQLYRRDLDAWEATPIAGTEGARSFTVSPDGAWIGFGATDGYKKVPLGGGTPTMLAEGVYVNFESDWSETGLIAASVGSDARDQAIYVFSENGGEVERVTDIREGRAFSPSWLPGGHSLLVAGESIEVLNLETRERRTLTEGHTPRYLSSGHLVFARGTTLWAVGFDLTTRDIQGAPVPVMEDIRRFGSDAAAGTLAFIPGAGETLSSLVWVDRTGNSVAVDGVRPDRFDYVALSPDGSRIAVDIMGPEGRDIWVLNLERGSRVQLTFGGRNEAQRWTADGRFVVFARGEEEWRAFRVLADGTGEPELLPIDGNVRNPDPASDGERFAWNPPRLDADVSIWSEETGNVSLDNTAGFEGTPRFDPSGRYLAYASDASGSLQLWVRDLETGEKWQVSSDGGKAGVWSRDGRALYYRWGGELWSVTFEQDPFAPSVPVLLFDLPLSLSSNTPPGSMPRYDVAPDGPLPDGATRDVSANGDPSPARLRPRDRAPAFRTMRPCRD